MNKLNILIVDDKEENIIALEALIARDDINIISTTSPNEALKLAWENYISLALVDVQMPGMDGFELVEMLKSNPRTKDILVIFVTAISKESKYAVKGLTSGAVDYLYKPLNPTITVAKVDAFIQLAKAQLEVKQKNVELEKYKVVISNSADLICLVGGESKRIEQINPAVEKILGYTPEELADELFCKLIPKDEKDAFDAQLAIVEKDPNQSLAIEVQLVHKNQELIWTECRISYNQKNYFVNISDHTLQKKFSEDLISSREEAIQIRNVKERFLANMSHELRTPLNGIIGISNLLKQGNLSEDQQQLVQLLEISSQSLLGVVNDILDISKIDSGKLSISKEEVNIRQLINAAIELLRFKANEKGVDLILEIDNNTPKYIDADALRLNQILMNLLSNALKFTEKGFVRLVVSASEKTEKSVKLKFEVIDTGIGIRKERQSKIFESYEQAEEDTSLKYGGTGLGLGIVKKLVELHHGEISFESDFGKGSSFTFEIEYEIKEHRHLSKKERQEVVLAPFDKVKVLIAEDNMVNQFMIKKILTNWNIETEIVDDGLLVLEKLKENDYDLILMDTHMPNLGGYETTIRIRNEFSEDKKNIKIISLSAAVLDDEKQAALDAGMNYILTKPFQPADMHRIIEQIVEQRK